MKRTKFRHLFLFIAALSLITITACGSSENGGGGGGGGAGTGDSPDLSSNDYPNDGVCNTGSTDVEAAMLIDVLNNATQITFTHLPYGTDSDIPFICGRDGVWDPTRSDAFDSMPPVVFTPGDNLSNILSGGHVFICWTGFGFFTMDEDGFHDATTYRTEVTVTDGVTTIRMRVRFTVSGDDAGKTLASLGLTANDLSIQNESGSDLNTVQDLLNLFASDAGSITVKLVSSQGVHITALGRVICWEQQ